MERRRKFNRKVFLSIRSPFQNWQNFFSEKEHINFNKQIRGVWLKKKFKLLNRTPMKIFHFKREIFFENSDENSVKAPQFWRT
jgi:hypothetical protein